MLLRIVSHYNLLANFNHVNNKAMGYDEEEEDEMMMAFEMRAKPQR